METDIRLRGIDHSDAIEQALREGAQALARHCDGILSCRITLELTGRHQHKGRQLAVRIDLKLPGTDIVVTHAHDEQFELALHGALDAARRQLDDLRNTSLELRRRQA